MSEFDRHLAEDRRLVILRALANETDYMLNEALIERKLIAYGHRVTRELVREDMEWLAAAKAISLSNPAGSTTLVARLLDAGQYHVENREVIEGVARPRLGG